jgi:hypothetical protein
VFSRGLGRLVPRYEQGLNASGWKGYGARAGELAAGELAVWVGKNLK